MPRRLARRDDAHLLVIAKAAVAGRVKTRLTPHFTPTEAAELAEAALTDTLLAVANVPAAACTVFLDGEVGPWLPDGMRVRPQRGGGLDERLAAVFDDAWSDLELPMLLVGMDTPQVSAELLRECLDRLLATPVDAALGLATDGGFWTLGLRRPAPTLLIGVPMSRDTTGTLQLDRLRDGGLRVDLLPTLTDVDTPADADAVAAVAPESSFARALRGMQSRR